MLVYILYSMDRKSGKAKKVTWMSQKPKFLFSGGFAASVLRYEVRVHRSRAWEGRDERTASFNSLHY